MYGFLVVLLFVAVMPAVVLSSTLYKTSSSEEPKKYKYSPPSVSVFYTLYYKPVYTAITPYLFPTWMHANVVTLVGLACQLSCFVLIAYYSDWFRDPDTVPWYAWTLAGFCFWGYMIADNCDGIQARRLGISSPVSLAIVSLHVGELMDHGCDAFTACCTGFILGFLYLSAGSHEARLSNSISFMMLFQYTFFATHIVGIFTGSLLVGYKYISVDELFILMGLILVLEGSSFPLRALSVPVPSFLSAYIKGDRITLAQVLATIVLYCPAVLVTLHMLRLWVETKRDTAQVVRIMVLPALSVLVGPLFLPYGVAWFVTWVPQFGLAVLDVVLCNMKEASFPWTLPFVGVVLCRMILGELHAAVASVVLYLASVTYILRQMQREYNIPSLFRVVRKDE